jgi:hypothetical protein
MLFCLAGLNPFCIMKLIKHRIALPGKRHFLFLWIAVLVFACVRKEKITGVDPAFSRYIDGYTSGVISKASVIRVRLSAETPVTHVLNEAIKEPLFSFSPSVKGKAYWTDARTIEFKPDEHLDPGRLYTVDFKLGKVTDVPDAFRDFVFNVQAMKPAFQVRENGLKVAGNSKEMMTLTGTVETADMESSATVEKLLTAAYQGQSPVITWEHNEAARTHQFTIANIKRSATVST